ncbi:MAG: class I SAM-dependent methyltransferase [Schleiferiaceae bacterium]|jgi:SAM-dependent methyltransferase|nr:class I SAM-dependent methyltransferase [Schleiferiaceae bacterium]
MGIKQKVQQFLSDKLGVTENKILIQGLSSYITLLGGDILSLPLAIKSDVLTNIRNKYGIDEFNTALHRNDVMLYNHIIHYGQDTSTAVTTYFEVGVDIAQKVSELCDGNTKEILDFGSGYGRVSRFLPFYFKDASIEVTEVKPASMQFQKEYLGFNTITHGIDASTFNAKPKDLIIAVSVFTHLTLEDCENWIEKLSQCLKENGRFIFTYNNIEKCPFKNNGEFHFETQSEDSSNSGIPDRLDDVNTYGSTYFSNQLLEKLIGDIGCSLEIKSEYIGTHNVAIVTKK